MSHAMPETPFIAALLLQRRREQIQELLARLDCVAAAFEAEEGGGGDSAPMAVG